MGVDEALVQFTLTGVELCVLIVQFNKTYFSISLLVIIIIISITTVIICTFLQTVSASRPARGSC